MEKSLTKTGILGIVLALACCITLFGCSGAKENVDLSNDTRQEQTSKNQEVIDKVNTIHAQSSGLLQLFGASMDCTSFKDGTATVECSFDAQKMIENMKQLAESMGADTSNFNSEEYQSKMQESIQQYKSQMNTDSMKDSTKQQTKDIVTNVDEVTAVNWIVTYDNEEVANYTQTEEDVADVEASSTITNEDGSVSIDLSSQFQKSLNDGSAYENAGWTLKEETDTEKIYTNDSGQTMTVKK